MGQAFFVPLQLACRHVARVVRHGRMGRLAASCGPFGSAIRAVLHGVSAHFCKWLCASGLAARSPLRPWGMPAAPGRRPDCGSWAVVSLVVLYGFLIYGDIH